VKCSTCDAPISTVAPQARALQTSSTTHHNSNPTTTRLAKTKPYTALHSKDTSANASANAVAMAMAHAVDMAEIREPEGGAPEAPAAYHGSSARKVVSPFSDVDEQITDAIILLNRLPNDIERYARERSTRSAQKMEQSQRWIRGHEPELMERVDVSRQTLSCVENRANKSIRNFLCSWECKLTQKTTPCSAHSCSHLVGLAFVFCVETLY
jgi:hypothetical protein